MTYEVHELTGSFVIDDYGRRLANESRRVVSRHRRLINAVRKIIKIKSDDSSTASQAKYEIRRRGDDQPCAIAYREGVVPPSVSPTDVWFIVRFNV